MADTKAKPSTQSKTDATSAQAGVKERKKPVRKAPKQSDYPTRLTWLAAMVEYEKAEAAKATAAKVARLDKRIGRLELEAKTIEDSLTKLREERQQLVGETVEVTLPEAEDETTAG